ncbi:biotin-dependent carboxyltransferase family protein [Alkalicoccus chagannorensis]|uniref:5-oxoprolinase subunit C family protein n=1 Tax=Alkalicoccus chagannorensis TaxID=427072 RepID=UPI0004180FF3|nr:biotin-dependent carboxyltransferase family protein [Alkalicoccus chagannorensis]
MAEMKIRKQGLLTTIQDQGRTGAQQYGIVVGGAMDPWALRLCNVLTGNDPGAAGLEVTMMGPELSFSEPVRIAVGGADLSAAVDGEKIPLWTAVLVPAGSVLSFGEPKFGVRAYIAVAGGVDVPEVMGSRATYIRAKLGGFRGRELRNGDVIPLGTPGRTTGRRRMHHELLPDYHKGRPVRIIPGPDAPGSLSLFMSETYRITNDVDRMGSRLEGPEMDVPEAEGMLSDAVAMGTIQITAGGQPILLMADRQTTGGYPRIATVIHEDLPKVAQMRPGEVIRFSTVPVEVAQQLRRHREKQFRRYVKLAAGGP